MLSVLGLLACATVAGMFAAKKWPEGPPRELPLAVWDWLAAHAAPPRGAAGETRYEGPAPPFNPSTPGHEADPSGFAPPSVEIGAPLEVERPPEGAPEPGANSAPPPRDTAPLEAWPISVPRQPGQRNLPRSEPGKPPPFWPGDLVDLVPRGDLESRSPASPETRSPASPSSRASGGAFERSDPSSSNSDESSPPSVEQLIGRLEQMGAVVMRLERKRGTAGYFFRCELPLRPGYHRFFQAADAEPAAAIQRVLREVEAWQSAQRR